MAKKHESGNCADKRCSKDKICNPASGRCVLRTGKIGKSLLAKQKTKVKSETKSGKCEGVRCSKDKICNPASGRCVLRTGKIGKSLLAKQKTKVKSETKSGKCEGVRCSKDKICNPASGRCVLRTGKIGKAVLDALHEPGKKVKAGSKSLIMVGRVYRKGYKGPLDESGRATTGKEVYVTKREYAHKGPFFDSKGRKMKKGFLLQYREPYGGYIPARR